MKTSIIAIISILLGFGAAYLLIGSTAPVDAASEKPDVQLYTCGMHPEIISTEPGICPICNMKLTPKKDGGQNTVGITIDPTARQNMGLKTVTAKTIPLTKTVHAFGRVAVFDPSRFTVRLKLTGWVEKLYVSEEGERLFKGAPLLEVYSPELVTAQKEYLAAAENAGQSEQLRQFMQLTERRLKNWDITDDQIDKLKTTGEISRTIPVRVPVDGFVLRKSVDAGDQVTPQTTLYEIADLATVWIRAFVYEQDVPHIGLKQKARVTIPSLPGEKFQSHVSYISPVLDDKGQVEIRLELDNPDFRLRPEMYANVDLHRHSADEYPAIPRTAVINSGSRQIVYVASGNDTFEPRIVTTGTVDDNDMIAITDGLTAGERVVTSGQFLLDSESRLNEAIGTGDGHRLGQSDMNHAEASESETVNRHDHDVQASDDPYDIHTCPMPVHYHVLNYGPGACPECGMDLAPVSETDNHDVFVCPMPQCGVAQNDSGICPVCNMHLVRYQPGGDS